MYYFFSTFYFGTPSLDDYFKLHFLKFHFHYYYFSFFIGPYYISFKSILSYKSYSLAFISKIIFSCLFLSYRSQLFISYLKKIILCFIFCHGIFFLILKCLFAYIYLDLEYYLKVSFASWLLFSRRLFFSWSMLKQGTSGTSLGVATDGAYKRDAIFI